MESLVQIKGIRDGLLITLGGGNWPEAQGELFDKLLQRSDFLQGARIILDVGNHVLYTSEMGKLRDALTGFGVSLKGVVSRSLITETTAKSLDLFTRTSMPVSNRASRSRLPAIPHQGEQGIVVQRILRSRSKLEYPGHVTVLGDVNPGAEIIARGSIVVWGHLRGVVHAGAEGDENGSVCALDLSPTRLRIAGHFSILPQQRGKSHPKIAKLRDGQVIVEPWSTNKK